MLILNRKANQSIMIGEDVKLTVTGIDTDRYGDSVVILGFEGPRHISIDRKEVRDRRNANMDKLLNGNDR